MVLLFASTAMCKSKCDVERMFCKRWLARGRLLFERFPEQSEAIFRLERGNYGRSGEDVSHVL